VKLRITAIAVGTAILLSGCTAGTKLAGIAVKIGDVSVSESDITTQVNEVRTQLEALPAGKVQQIPSLVLLNQMVINNYVLERVIAAGLVAKGLSVTDAQVTEFKNSVFQQYGQEAIEIQIASQQGVSTGKVDDFMRMVVSQQLIAQSLVPNGTSDEQNQALVAYLGDLSRTLNVQVSPRFGEWNPNKVQVDTGDLTLSQPAPVTVAQ
jgi:outer membrane murein-binding lipoprotein Lpp